MTAAQLVATRKRLNLSLAKFAAAVGYKDRQSIARMERGASPITARVELAVMRLSAGDRVARRRRSRCRENGG